MKNFLLVLKGTSQAWSSQSQSRQAELLRMYAEWVRDLSTKERYQHGAALSGDARAVRKSDSGWVVDGPFSETKELLTGYVLIRALDMENAVELAKSCPAFVHGDHIEVYEVSP